MPSEGPVIIDSGKQHLPDPGSWRALKTALASVSMKGMCMQCL